MHVDLLIKNAAQLITCASPKPKRGAAMKDVGLIANGAIAITDGHIVALSTTENLRDYTARETIDAANKVVCPGFVDCHTHIAFGGNRLNEFEMRIQGATYMEIMNAGGGIMSTVRATRSASKNQLIDEAATRLDTMLALGTTTVEIKTGYGLDTATELKLLHVIEALASLRPVDIVPTFLGAHAVPAEYKDRADVYLELVIQEMLPAVKDWYEASLFAQRGIPLFADVFCEANVFDREQSRRVLQAAKDHGMGIKAHVDEFKSLNGVTMALELGAISVDHLDVTGIEEIAALAASDTIAVPLPAVNFNLGSTHFANARAMLDSGAALALATDMNPGSAPCYSMPFIMAIASRYQRLTPAEALNASTINAAYAIGLGDRLGSLEVGKQADVLIINTPDYREIVYEFGGNRVEQVIKKGQIVL